MTAQPALGNLEKANQCDVLWPPVAEAVDTMIRRTDAGAGGFERVWRLIHIWEALSAALTGAAVSRLRALSSSGAKNAFLTCREQLYGRTMDTMSRQFNRFQGALHGSATRRIDILWHLSGYRETDSRFLVSLRDFLLAGGVNLSPLTTSWGRICDVPPDAVEASTFTVRDTFRHINTFRNRFAHVPFPYDELEDLANALASVTDQVFGMPPQPWQGFTDERTESPLNGAFLFHGRRLRGCRKAEPHEPRTEVLLFSYPALCARSDECCETWEGAPFAYVDSMRRPSILTRLRSEEAGVWEFTRFLAERNSVISEEQPRWLELLPIPAVAEYPRDTAAEEESTATPGNDKQPSSTQLDATTRIQEALQCIANDDFAPAISILQDLVHQLPGYHTGWLRLGYAQRELAMRKRFADPEESKRLFGASIEALARAGEHAEPRWRAQAHYERSKAYFHRGRLLAQQDDLSAGLTDAEAAFAISPDTKYETWIAYIKQHLQRQVPNPPTD